MSTTKKLKVSIKAGNLKKHLEFWTMLISDANILETVQSYKIITSRGNRFITSEACNYSSARNSTGIYIHNFLGSEEIYRNVPNIKPETLEQFYGNISFQYGDSSNSSKFTAERRLSGQC